MLTLHAPRATEQRAQLDDLTAQFLASGGTIKTVPGFTEIKYQRAEKKPYMPGTRPGQQGLDIATQRPASANPVWTNANLIANLIRVNKLVRRDVAIACGLPSATLGGYLTKRINPSATTARKIEKTVGDLLAIDWGLGDGMDQG